MVWLGKQTSSVWPSGKAFATASAARLPPAPARFSTSTGWPSDAASGGAIARAIVSVVPPADAPTSSLIGWVGYSAALHGGPAKNTGARRQMTAAILRARIVVLLSLPPTAVSPRRSSRSGDRPQPLDRRAMDLVGECGAAVGDDRAVELAHMGVAHRRGDAAVGDDAGEIQLFHGAFAQHPFETRHVKRRIGDLLDADVGGRERIDELLTPAAGREVAAAQERPQLAEVRRDDRF